MKFFKVIDNIYINLEKARITKYIRRWKSDGKWRYLYKEDFNNPFKALAEFFSFSKDKAKKIYEDKKIKEKYKIDEKTFSSHLLEYLSNRKKWDLYFSSKKEKKISNKDKKDTVKKSSTKLMNQQTKMSFNKDIMKEIYNHMNGIKEKEEPIDKKIIEEKRKDKEIIEEKIDKKIDKEEKIDIPDQFKNKPINRKKLEIISKGKKYYKVKVPGEKFLMDLFITKSNDNFKTGDILELNVIEDKQRNKFGTKVQFFPLSDDNLETLKKDESREKLEEEELNKIFLMEEEESKERKEKKEQQNKKDLYKWLGYVKEAAKKGYVYEKGVEKLYALGIEKIEDLNNELKDVVNKAKNKKIINKIYTYLGYMQEAARKGYVYTKGLETLKSLGIENYPDAQEKLNNILSTIEKKENKENKSNYTIFSENSFVPKLNVPTKLGDKIVVYENTGKTFYIPEEDEFLFGATAGAGRAARFYYRDATEEEIQEYNKRKEQNEKNKNAKKDLYDLKDKFSSFIIGKGEYIPREDEQIRLSGKKYLDTIDIYGGGEYYLVDDKEKYLWFVRNNGLDGDDWSRNNIYTGGAGGIGHRIEYNDDIKEKFKKLLDANEFVNKIKKS